MTVITTSPAQTEQLGERLARILEGGDIVTLQGDLGAGKTRFSQGVAFGLGVERSYPITSPTYTILNEYEGRLPLYHFDFYRFGAESDLRELGFEEQFYGRGVCLVEWPQRLAAGFSEEYLEIRIDLLGDDARSFTLIPHGSAFEARVVSFGQNIKKCFDHDSVSCY